MQHDRHSQKQPVRFIRWILLLIVLAGMGFVVRHYAPEFEWYAPEVEVAIEGEYLGLGTFAIHVYDQGKGLKQIRVGLRTVAGELELFNEKFKEGVLKQDLELSLKTKRKSLREGPASLIVEVVDHSKWWFFSGNRTVVKRPIIIDLTPPKVEVLSRDHNVTRGGSGLIIYRVSDDVERSGVKIGDYFFDGEAGQFKDPGVRLAFFAYPYDVSKAQRPVVVAEDRAGNQTQSGMYFVLKNRRYRKRTINVSDGFIERKVLPLLAAGTTDNLLSAYLEVNQKMRAENAATIKQVASTSRSQRLWSGPFFQLSNSKVEAQFADYRTYMYKGKAVDHQYHLGFDLAVTQRYPIEAANSGVVVFAGPLGIYGNTVMIDHGLGILTLYAHLSGIEIKKGDTVKARQRLGRSGVSGLAGGDHLHYGIYIRGVPVLPLEWWDPSWIEKQIERKLKDARAEG
ncbi:MAG TPA: M23 family metallopeptidase [Acidiferrobacteraceae bacterium]|nr:M23 family metallopeptidase [Acidiferrobacteraceae bacterium]